MTRSRFLIWLAVRIDATGIVRELDRAQQMAVAECNRLRARLAELEEIR